MTELSDQEKKKIKSWVAMLPQAAIFVAAVVVMIFLYVKGHFFQ